jgi:hypothetical protein
MSEKPRTWDRAELLALLSASATLAGLCITVVALMNTLNSATSSLSIVDDVLAVCAGMFLLCTFCIFWALKAPTSALSSGLSKVADGLFLLALSGMTVAGFISLHHLVA